MTECGMSRYVYRASGLLGIASQTESRGELHLVQVSSVGRITIFTDRTMASQSPPPRPSMEAQDTPVKSEIMALAPGSGGVSRSDLEIMKGIVDHLTEAKDEK